MKNLSLFVSAFALFASSASAQTINCGTLPTCESLGYNDVVAQCPNKSIKCPFDTAKGTCLHEAAVGEIGYFIQWPGNGWLYCDGKDYEQKKYPDLFAVIEQKFCNNTHHGRGYPTQGAACKNGYFRVPDYSGYFLRAKGAPESTYGGSGNSDIANPQKEQLPNITGSFYIETPNNKTYSGAFSYGNETSSGGSNTGGAKNMLVNFLASSSNSIYNGSHVIPANYAVEVYIYAGRVVE